MAAFSKESLSPRPVPAEVVPLPFELTWSDLAPALPKFASSSRSNLVASRRFELQGLRGRDRSALVTVEIGSASTTLFVKRAAMAERDRYLVLQKQGVPLPRLLAGVVRDDHLVLVFEFLDAIGVDVSDPDEVDELLRLVARLNAVDAAAATRLSALAPGRPEAEFTESVLRALIHVADLDLLRVLEPDTWLSAYVDSKRRASSMPQGLTHGEFYFQQVGRRADGPLLVLDVATVALRPRFSDMCSILAPLARGTTEADIFARYLESLHALGVERFDPSDALAELRWLRILNAFQSLPWLTRSYNDPELGLAHLEERVATLHRDLVDLKALRE